MLTLTRRCENGTATVLVAGELDAMTAPDLAALLDAQMTGQERDLVVDLREVTFMSSAGLHVLLTATSDTAVSGIRLRVHATGSRAVERILRAAGGTDLLPLSEPPQAA
jgi:anti-sigma B factor antagonist